MAISQNLELKEKLAGDTFEGVITAGEAHALAQKFNLKLPIVEGVYGVIYENKNPKE